MQNRWYRLMPVVFTTYSLAYLDRANFGFAAAGGMAADLHITASLSSLLSALFFLGYFLFQIPGTLYAVNTSVRKLIFWSLILWGMLAMATGIAGNISLLIFVRFVLGAVESAVMPAMLIFLSRWFTKDERSRANTFLILGNPVTILWMSILSGYLVHALSWRWMFILEGLPAIIWAFFWRWLVNDHPEDANWLSAAQKKELYERLDAEQLTTTPMRNYTQAFRSKTVILLCLQYALWSIGVYGFVMWLPTIIHAAPKINIIKTGWLASVPYLFAMITMIGASHFSDKWLNRKMFVWPFLMSGAVAFYASYIIGSGHFWFSFCMLIIAGAAMYAPYGPFFAIITEILPKNVSGGAIALINSMGALGSFAGTYLVGYLNGATGGFSTSYLFMAASLLLSSILTIGAVRRQHKNMGVPVSGTQAQQQGISR